MWESNSKNTSLKKIKTGKNKVHPLTIFGMLIIVWKVANMYIKVYGFMIRRLVCEAEAVDSFMMGHKLKFLTDLITKIMNLITSRSLHLQSLTTFHDQCYLSQETQKIEINR